MNATFELTTGSLKRHRERERDSGRRESGGEQWEILHFRMWNKKCSSFLGSQALTVRPGIVISGRRKSFGMYRR
jgi:hypothetical protein